MLIFVLVVTISENVFYKGKVTFRLVFGDF